MHTLEVQAKSSRGERAPRCFPNCFGREKSRSAAATAAGSGGVEFCWATRYPSGCPDPAPWCGIAPDAYSLAVTCGSRGVSRDIWPASHSAPAAPRAVRLSGHDRDRSPSRTTRRATTWFPPRRSPGRRGVPPAPWRPSWPSWSASVRALPRMWRTVPCDASTAYAAALQQGTGAALGAAITRRALRPGNVACGDSDCGAP